MMFLDILNQFDFFSVVPLGGPTTYGELAQKTSMPESTVRRVLQHAFTNHLFAESPVGSGRVVHTAATALVAKTPSLSAWLAHHQEEAQPATVHQEQSLRRFSADMKPSQEITESAFALADLDKTGCLVTYWDYLKVKTEGKPANYRAKRFVAAMELAAGHSSIKPFDVLERGFVWARLGNATIVDVITSCKPSFPTAGLFPPSVPKNSVTRNTNGFTRERSEVPVAMTPLH